MNNYIVKEATYFPKQEELEIEVVETLDEHQVQPAKEIKINVIINEDLLNEELGNMKMRINKEDFKALFGPKTKPRKGDVVSIEGLQKKYKIKKSKKFSAKKKGKGFKLTLKSVKE